RSFHSRHAVWHALQPMHFDTSISLATSACRWAGGVTWEAERRIKSCSPNRAGVDWTVGFGSGGNMVLPPYATGPVMGSISTRNALYSGGCALASPTGGVSVLIGVAFLASPMKPKLSGIPMVCTVLPATCSGLSRLVTTALPLTEPRWDETLTQPPGLIPFSLASCSEISTKNSGCMTAFMCTALVQ